MSESLSAQPVRDSWLSTGETPLRETQTEWLPALQTAVADSTERGCP